jgi:hypothetical protein
MHHSVVPHLPYERAALRGSEAGQSVSLAEAGFSSESLQLAVALFRTNGGL